MFLRSPAFRFRDRAFQCCGRRGGHAGRGGFPHDNNLRRSQGVGLVDEVAAGALQSHGFDGAGAGGRAEKLKSGKQKAEIARRRARHRAAASCRGYALRLTAMKRSPARTSVPQKHDILTNRLLSDPSPINACVAAVRVADRPRRGGVHCRHAIQVYVCDLSGALTGPVGPTVRRSHDGAIAIDAVTDCPARIRICPGRRDGRRQQDCP